MNTVPYTQFADITIVVGHIVSAAVVPEADRLLQLMVDVGEAEPRQVVSGIREYFPDEQVLVGQRCPFVINLEPREIRGLVSQAMILAAHHGDQFSLLRVDPTLPPGTPVR